MDAVSCSLFLVIHPPSHVCLCGLYFRLAVFFRVFSQYVVWIAAGIVLKDVVTSYFNKGGADAAV